MVLVQQKKPRNTVHHQKRYGKHQKRTRPYVHTYWPYLPIVAIIVAGLLVSNLWAHSSKGVLGYATDISATSLLSDTNNERSQDHETALKLNSQLTVAAQTKANDMAARNYWSHDTPNGVPPWVFIKNAGYNYTSAGENLAYGFSTSADTLSAWMASPKHRANILDAKYQDVGFGIANASNYQNSGPETVVVAMYGQPASAAAAAVSPSSPTQAVSPVATVVGSSSSPTIKTIASQPVSRIQLLDGSAASWSLLAVSALAGAGFALLIIRHGLLWRRTLARSEAFIIHHPWFDIGLVTLVMVGFVLSRSAGVIL